MICEIEEIKIGLGATHIILIPFSHLLVLQSLGLRPRARIRL